MKSRKVDEDVVFCSLSSDISFNSPKMRILNFVPNLRWDKISKQKEKSLMSSWSGRPDVDLDCVCGVSYIEMNPRGALVVSKSNEKRKFNAK